MKNKLKELSKYCCKPANEQEYEFIKTCARLGGVEWGELYYDKDDFLFFSIEYMLMDAAYKECTALQGLKEIPVTQLCDILLKDESEFDDRVYIEPSIYSKHQNVDITPQKITARDGYKFRLSEDCQTVELIKSEQ